jgi:hypothetical protein
MPEVVLSLPDFTKFEPLNEFELQLSRAHRGHMLPDLFTAALANASVWVLADREMQPGVWDMEAMPLIVADQAGSDILAAFSHPSRAQGWVEKFPSHPHLMRVDVQWLLGGMPPGVGIAINLGWAVSLALPPDRLNELKGL